METPQNARRQVFQQMHLMLYYNVRRIGMLLSTRVLAAHFVLGSKY